jgi:hypothetical protein
MKIPSRNILMIAAAAAVALVAMLWWMKSSRDRAAAIAPRPALLPYRPPKNSDGLLAALINNLDSDMRSIEIGSWFVGRLRAQILAKTDPVKCDTLFDLASIANGIPGANPVTKVETIVRLQRLVTELFKGCDGQTTKAALVRTLDMFEDDAFKPGSGLLLSMPYSLKSSKPLPK